MNEIEKIAGHLQKHIATLVTSIAAGLILNKVLKKVGLPKIKRAFVGNSNPYHNQAVLAEAARKAINAHISSKQS